VHLDTAAAGRSSLATLAATAAHAEREAMTGAYVAAAEAAPVLAAGRAELARLLGVPAAGLAFVPNAEEALDALLLAWPFSEGDTVAVVRSEWGPNLHAFGARGLRVTEIATADDGAVDLAGLESMLAGAPPALVHLTQVASHRPLVQPVAAAAALCRAAGVPLWVDAAQALGHVDTACGADAIYSTSRKWLTGPRGVGLIGVTERWWSQLSISASPLMANARPADSSPLWLLEAGEANVAAWIGLCTAVQEYVQAGPARIWQRLAEVGQQTRQALADVPGWTIAAPAAAASTFGRIPRLPAPGTRLPAPGTRLPAPGTRLPASSVAAATPAPATPAPATPAPATPARATPALAPASPSAASAESSASAITALRATNGQDITATRTRLLEEYGIVTTAAVVARAPRDMTEPLLRISPHVDCTPEDLAHLRAALIALA
jgi:hercynylcysteine S-oxide lyase